MDDLIAARSTMAFSLAFHIIFASIGMVMPFLMSTAHYFYLKTGENEYLRLTKMWMKGVAILFAVGAVSGTVLSLELGLLWPGFMKYAGPIIGMPFSWEGTAFFLEAIAIGIYLYGWGRVSPWIHWTSGLFVGISGIASGIFVIAANGWMNMPTGFEWNGGNVTNVDPVAAMFNEAWPHQAAHMIVGAFSAVGLAAAGIHAFLLLKGRSPKLNKSAIKIGLAYGAVASILQLGVGHFSAQEVAVQQPAKLAAMEGHFHTGSHAPVYLGGFPNTETMEMEYGIPIPGMLSFLAFDSVDAVVKGLDQYPRDEWPPILIVHYAFQIMVGIGTLLAALAVFGLYQVFYKKQFTNKLLWALLLCSPLGFIAIETGWVVTEVGRQPWVIYGFLKTKDALTPVPGMQYHFYLFLVLYLLLAAMTAWLMKRQIQAAQDDNNGN